MSFSFGPGIVKDGLVLYLDAANPQSYISGSTTWNDLSGNRNTGSLIGDPTFNSANGGIIVFDGTNDYFNRTTQIDDNMNTISIFVNLKSNQSRNILYYGEDSPNSNLWTWGMAIFPDATIGFAETNLNLPNSSLYSETVALNVWKNYVLVRNDNGDAKVYVNGELKGTKIGAGTTSIRNSIDRLRMAKAGTEYTNMEVSSIRIYNKSLSAQEVLQNYNALKSRFGLT